MAEGQVCCCGSNRGWLLFLVSLRIIGCIIGIFLGVRGIVAINKIEEPADAESAALLQRIYIELWVVLVSSAIILLINLLPIIAEIKKKPRLLLAFRNWTILILIFQIVIVCLLMAEVGFRPHVGGVEPAEVAPIAQQISAIFVIILTLALVQRRMKELQEEIGETSFLKFV